MSGSKRTPETPEAGSRPRDPAAPVLGAPTSVGAESRLPRKLLLFFLGFCAVPLCVLTLVSYWMAARAVRQMLDLEASRELRTWQLGLQRVEQRLLEDAETVARYGMQRGMPLRRAMQGEPVGDELLTQPLGFVEQRMLFRSLVLVSAEGQPRVRLYAPGLAGPNRLLRMTRVERRGLAAEDTLGFAMASRRAPGPVRLLRRGAGVPSVRVLCVVAPEDTFATLGVLVADVPVADLLLHAARTSFVSEADSSSAMLRFALDRRTGAFLANDA